MKIGIVGGGLIGLTAAFELLKQGHQVTVYESEPECGGLTSTVQTGDLQLEKFYHHIFTSDQILVQLIEELGLSSRLSWVTPYNGTYINHRFYPFNTPMDLLLFKELPVIERFRLGLLVLRSRFIKNWEKLESINAKEWVIRNAGPNAYHKYWGPLLQSKFDRDADQISATWLWNKFKLRGSTRGKNLNKELLGYLRGSFGLVCRTLAGRIMELGGQINCNSAIRQICPQSGGTMDLRTDQNQDNYERVIVTTAPDILLQLFDSPPRDYASRLQRIKYKANICLILELSEPLSRYYWITVADKDCPFVAVIEHTNLVPEPGYGSHIVYLSRYLDAGDDLYSASDSHIIELFLTAVQEMFPNWDRNTVRRVRVQRARYAQPVAAKNYTAILPDFKTPVPNLYLASMAQIYPEDRGQNYAVRTGIQIAVLVNEDS